MLMMIGVLTNVNAQSSPLFTQYYEVPSFYNPAAIGRTDFVRVRAGGRMQWVGIDKAPQSILLTADMPVMLFEKRLGIGAVMQQDKAGLFSSMGAGLQAGYKHKLSKTRRAVLTGAFQIGVINEGFKGSEVKLNFDDDYHQATDEAIPTSDVNGNAVDMGVGVMLDHPDYYLGLSVTHLNAPSIDFSGEAVATTNDPSTGADAKRYRFDIKRQMYLIGGYNIPLKNTLFEIMPSVLGATDFTDYTFEVTARARWKKFITAGIGYRYQDAVSVSLSADYKGFFMGYSYDYPVSAISKVSSGSHELVAGYSFKLDLNEKNRFKHKSILTM